MSMTISLSTAVTSSFPLHSVPLLSKHEAHQGVTRSKDRARLTVCWPGIDHEIEVYIADCKLWQKPRQIPRHVRKLRWVKCPGTINCNKLLPGLLPGVFPRLLPGLCSGYCPGLFKELELAF